jgi:hypothetical protein
MAEEPTTADKVDQVYRQQFDMQRATMHMMAEQHQQELKRERDSHIEQRKQLQADFEDRRREFERQNDGMLGAIGRLHAESEGLRKKLDEAEARYQQQCLKSEAAMREVEARIQEHQAEHDRHVSDVKADAELKIKDLEKQLAAAKARSKKR